ncbi:MAG: DUF4189 domain-containing protein [Pseudomonadota bacterium]
MRLRLAYPLVFAVAAIGTPVFADWAVVYVHEPSGRYWIGVTDHPQFAAVEARQQCFDATGDSPDCSVLLPMRTTRQCAAIMQVGARFLGEEGETIEAATDAAQSVCEAEAGQTCDLVHAFCLEE